MKQNFTTAFLVSAFVLCVSSAFGQQHVQTTVGPAPVQPSNQHIITPPTTQNVMSRAWCYLNPAWTLNKQTLANTTVTPVGTAQVFGFPGASAWVPTTNRLYVVDQSSPFALYTVDTTTGARTFVANCTGMPQTNLVGMTWDITTSTMYGVSTSLSASSIFTMNITTGVCTPIGAPSLVCVGAIMINASRGGNLYSIDIVNDNLFRWNKVTGVATLVGSTGLNPNFGQDGHFDMNDNKYYWAAYTTGPELRVIDTVTGASTLVGAYTGQASTLAIKPICTTGARTQTLVGCAGFSVTVGSNVHNTTGTFVDVLVGVQVGGCDSVITTNLTINPLPTVTANSSSASVCAGNSVTLTGGGASTYSWSGGVINAVSFTPLSTLTYTVTGTSAAGCVNTATTTVTVNSLPTVTANTTASTVCAGTSVTLTGGGAFTYTWDNSVVDAVSFVPTATTTYMVTGTDVNGCVNTATTTVTVNALPTVTANTTASTVCAGTSVTLTGGGASTYTWDNSVVDGVSFVPTATTTYMVTGTDGNGCTNTAMTTVTVNPLPIVTATSTSPAVCFGSGITLTGGGATSYTWDNSVVDAVSFVPAATTTYMVTGTDANGCMNTATITVVVNSLPIVALGPDVAQCSGTATFDAGNIGSSFLWSDASTSQMLTVNTSGTYYVDVTDLNGCFGSDTVVATINANPIVDLGSDIIQCGGTVLLDAGNPGSTYLWSDASTAQTLLVSTSGTYYVTDTLPGGCFNSDTIVVTINPLPTVTGTAAFTTVCVDDASFALTGTPAGGTWSGPGVTGSTFSPIGAGVGSPTVTYTYTDSITGCSNFATVDIFVNACVGVNEVTLANGVNVFPNPNNGSFTLFVTANVGILTIEMTDIQGRVVYSSVENNVLPGFAKQISMDNVANGVYLLRLTSTSEQRIDKVSVQK